MGLGKKKLLFNQSGFPCALGKEIGLSVKGWQAWSMVLSQVAFEEDL
jgi:hypothetical protein